MVYCCPQIISLLFSSLFLRPVRYPVFINMYIRGHVSIQRVLKNHLMTGHTVRLGIDLGTFCNWQSSKEPIMSFGCEKLIVRSYKFRGLSSPPPATSGNTREGIHCYKNILILASSWFAPSHKNFKIPLASYIELNTL